MIASGLPADSGGSDPGAALQSMQDNLTSGGWVAGGLSTGGGLAALDTRMRPIDALPAAGLDWLTSQVQPLQDALDRLAGSGSAIQTFADACRRTSQTTSQVQQQLAGGAVSGTQQWQGSAADAYRAQAAQLSTALQATATVYAATSTVTTMMGGVVAGARTQVNAILTDLVRRLTSYVPQACAAEGGPSPSIMSQATSMINTCATQISNIEQQLAQTIGNLAPLINGDGAGPVAGTQNGGQGRIQLAFLEGPPGSPTTDPRVFDPPDYKPYLPPPPPGMPPPQPRPPWAKWIGRLTLIGVLIDIFEWMQDEDRRHEVPQPSPGTPPAPQPGTAPADAPQQQPPAPEHQPGTPPQDEHGTAPQATPPGTGTQPQSAPPDAQPAPQTQPENAPPTTPQSTPQQGTTTTMEDDPTKKPAEPAPESDSPKPDADAEPLDGRKDGELQRTQKNVDKAIEKYGIELEPNAKPLQDNGLRRGEGEAVLGSSLDPDARERYEDVYGQEPNDDDPVLRIGPGAFKNEETLAKTIYEENFHAGQLNANGGPPQSIEENQRWESEAKDAVDQWWNNHPLNPSKR